VRSASGAAISLPPCLRYESGYTEMCQKDRFPLAMDGTCTGESARDRAGGA
jgi:hypothetical protein